MKNKLNISAVVVAAGALVYHIHQSTSSPPPPIAPAISQPIVRTNKPTSVLIGYRPKNEVFSPPILPTNAPYGAVLQYATNPAGPWKILTFSMVTWSNDYAWIVYSSNFVTHVITPTQTNSFTSVWNISRSNIGVGAMDALFFRYRTLTNSTDTGL